MFPPLFDCSPLQSGSSHTSVEKLGFMELGQNLNFCFWWTAIDNFKIFQWCKISVNISQLQFVLQGNLPLLRQSVPGSSVKKAHVEYVSRLLAVPLTGSPVFPQLITMQGSIMYNMQLFIDIKSCGELEIDAAIVRVKEETALFMSVSVFSGILTLLQYLYTISY